MFAISARRVFRMATARSRGSRRPAAGGDVRAAACNTAQPSSSNDATGPPAEDAEALPTPLADFLHGASTGAVQEMLK